jgi:hypothetical protein
MMFCGSQGYAVSRFLIPHAWRIVESTVEMPQNNWVATVLAAAYRGLCTGCTKTGTQSILLGCPLLLHLWSYERLPVPAGSYCYTLVKCLKPFVRNGKGVIEANDHAQGPPINIEALVMKQTHSNEKRALKATASLSVFGMLSVSLLHFLFC